VRTAKIKEFPDKKCNGMRENTQNNILFGSMLEGDIQNRGRYENGKADTFLYYVSAYEYWKRGGYVIGR
jgi:hypothetical protein